MLSNTALCSLDIMWVLNQNSTPLTMIYKDQLSKLDKNDIVVFIHDDIEFTRKGWGVELMRMFEENEKYGVIGVAGSDYFDANAAWWNYKGHLYGQVIHCNGNNSWLSEYSPLYEHDLEEVVVIDGIFIAVNKNRVSQTFDDKIIGFNFYDIDFCLNNVLDDEFKIGVTTKIRVKHKSMGQLSNEWYYNKEIVNEKYEEFYPIQVLEKNKPKKYPFKDWLNKKEDIFKQMLDEQKKAEEKKKKEEEEAKKILENPIEHNTKKIIK